MPDAAPVVLIFPPQCDPRAPYLALPTLAASLRAAGIPVTLLDANLAAYRHFLAPGPVDRLRVELAARHRDLTGRTELTEDERIERTMLGLLLDQAGLDGESVGRAAAALRDPARFYDPAAYSAAYETLTGALTLTALRHPPSVFTFREYLTARSRYAVDEILAATADPDNLFREFFQSETVPAVLAAKPRCCGITITNPQQVIPGFTLARLLKTAGIFTVLGGASLTRLQERIDPRWFAVADAFIAYDGEAALVALARALEGTKNLDTVPNLIRLVDGAVVRPERFQLADLAAAPLPDFAGLPLDDYYSPARVLPYDPVRGCHWNRCAFCDIPYPSRVAGTATRAKPPARVVADLRALREKYGARHFIFTAEGLAPDYLRELSDGLLAAKLGIHWLAYARMEEGFTAELLRQLVAAGCRKLLVGLETASDRILAAMEKGITVAGAQRFIDDCAAAGLPLHLFLIYGFPDETDADTARTLAFLQRNRAFLARPENSLDVTRYAYTRHSTVAVHPERYAVELDPARYDAAPAVPGRGPGMTGDQIDLMYEQVQAKLDRMFPRRALPFGEEHALLYNSR